MNKLIINNSLGAPTVFITTRSFGIEFLSRKTFSDNPEQGIAGKSHDK
jgi:hypothetical protein